RWAFVQRQGILTERIADGRYEPRQGPLGCADRDRKGRRAAAGARQAQGCQASEEIRPRGAEAAHAIGRRSATRAHERSGNAGGGIRRDILQWRRLRGNRDGGQEPPVGGDDGGAIRSGDGGGSHARGTGLGAHLGAQRGYSSQLSRKGASATRGFTPVA